MEAINHKILLIEDDDNDVALIRRAFRKASLSYPIYEARDGDTAIDYLTGVGIYADRAAYPSPTLIILDLKLPRRNGLEILAWAKKREELRQVPIVIFSSSREHLDIQQAYDCGANSYLVKPVEFNALQQLMQSLTNFWLVWNESPLTSEFLS